MSTLITELTPLQFKVVLLMAAGMTFDEISAFLNIGREVVQTMSYNICEKTRCSSRVDVVMRYVDEAEQGLYQCDRSHRNSVVDIESRARQLLSSKRDDGHNGHNGK